MIDLYLPPKPAIIRVGEPWETRLRENLARTGIPFGVQLAIIAEMRRLVGSDMALFGAATKGLAKYAGKSDEKLTLQMAGMLLNPFVFGGAPIGTPTSIGSAASSPSGTTITFATNANIVAGNLVVIVIGWNSTNIVTSSSVSDGTNSYTKAVEIANVSAANTAVAIYYNENVTAVSSGATVTATMSGSLGATNCSIGGAQVSGISTSSLDKTASNQNASSASCTATTATLSQSNEVLFGVAIALGGPTGYNGASGFTNLFLPNVTSVYVAMDYQKVSATTAISYTPTWNASSVRNAVAVASFKGF